MKPAIAVIAALAAIAFAGPALAAGPVHTACKDDIAKFCAEKGQKHGATRACLDANKDKVSEGCRTVLEQHSPGQNKMQNKEKSAAPDE